MQKNKQTGSSLFCQALNKHLRENQRYGTVLTTTVTVVTRATAPTEQHPLQQQQLKLCLFVETQNLFSSSVLLKWAFQWDPNTRNSAVPLENREGGGSVRQHSVLDQDTGDNIFEQFEVQWKKKGRISNMKNIFIPSSSCHFLLERTWGSTVHTDSSM